MHTSTEVRDLNAAKDGESLNHFRFSQGAAVFAAGFAIASVVLHVAVTRPMTQEFARIQNQMSELQRGVQKLTGHTEQAAKTSELLGLLAEQGRQSRAASEALAEIKALQTQLVSGQGATAEARTAVSALTSLRREALDAQADSQDVALALDNLQSLQDRLIGQYHSIVNANATLAEFARLRTLAEAEGPRTADARRALESLIELESRTLAERERADQAVASLERWEGLNELLIHSADKTAEAREVGEELVAIKETILCGSDAIKPQLARETLEELVKIRERLSGQAAEIAAAQAGLEGLLSLKDRILARTSDLADAVETLELAGDLNRQLQDAMRQFESVRRCLVEIVMLEPTVEHAVAALKPLADLANLRRLSPAELRQAAQVIADDRAARVAAKQSDIPGRANVIQDSAAEAGPGENDNE